jgi:chemotaxis protein CheD
MEDAVLTPSEPMTVYTPLTTTPAPDPVYVPPGRLLVGREEKPLTTIVSTGATVCVWDPTTGAGGMAHFLLPEAGSAPPATRFGDVALRTMVEELGKLGVPEKRLRARVFGGSAPPIATSGRHLGDRNVEAALSFLKAHFIPVIENQVGGTTARKIVFTPSTGAATVVSIGLTN